MKNLKELKARYGVNVQPFANTDLPIEVKTITGLLSQIGKPFIVGGCVRDMLVGMVPSDFDIEVFDVSLNKISSFLRGKGYHVNTTGQSFGVVKAALGAFDFDISVPRREVREGVGHTGFGVSFDKGMTIVEAAQRRDFTVNAIMYDLENEVILDPFDGMSDLKAKVLRHTSTAFSEDPLRVLRAFQFAARYNFTIAPETAQMARTLRDEYSSLAVERVKGEWAKFYNGIYPSNGINVLRDTGWDDTVPDLSRVDLSALDAAALEEPVVIAALIAFSTGSSRKFLEATVIGNKAIAQAETLSQSMQYSDYTDTRIMEVARALTNRGLTVSVLVRSLNYLGVNTASLEERARAFDVLDSAPAVLLTAQAVLDEFPERSAGPWLGIMMKRFLLAQDSREITDRDGALVWARNYVREYLSE